MDVVDEKKSKSPQPPAAAKGGGLEALLSLAQAAAASESPKVEGKGTKRPRPTDLSIRRKRVRAKGEGPIVEGPGFCKVGNAPPMHQSKHSTRHVSAAYYIYYQQRKSMREITGPQGQTIPVSLDPTLEARLLKERTEWVKRSKRSQQGEQMAAQQQTAKDVLEVCR
mmetsp:Transcript_4222/g.6275  ORF Transcript_4222/g.6275 Transcript_4222/m.6275 type:complete len:167 (-) Transcript_4222:124-624(-)|eukprot:CAMPEP_0167743704 /NCGR_PEP_ID=MMETSP0110_2-20121227/2162_1 /TAXON_ID=629695 /ORGANISM="Gymnochlora sp., Strain CCMP2014" /LENGTH=166 /DNA_ID=CAMNT_0007628101 /DNA_START=92 /DNA_END=592 /DNA_ORIENTATION=-